MKHWKKTMLLVGLLAGSPLSHAGVFVLTASLDGYVEEVTYSWDTLDSAIDALKNDQLQTLLPGYTGVEAASISLNLRGEMAYLTFPSAGANTLVFSIPSLNVYEVFEGGSRDESQGLWRDYLKSNTSLLEDLMRQLVKTSPIDPIAGNPHSLMTRSVQQDYEVMLRPAEVSAADGEAPRNRFGIGLDYSSMESAGIKSRSLTLPLSYARALGEPNHELRLNMPITLTQVGSAKVYETNFSGYYRRPLTARWLLGVQTGVRATGSKDLGSLGVLGGASVMSSYTWGDEWRLTMGNLIGRNQTLTMRSDGVSYNPGIGNNVFRNGFLLASPGRFDPLGVGMDWEWFWADTRFAGTELYNRWQEEVGVSYGTPRRANARDAELRGGFTYVKAQHAHGFRCNFGVWF